MLRQLLATACSWTAVVATAPAPSFVEHSPPAVHQPLLAGADEKALKALDAWLRLYRSGKIAYLSKDNIAKDSLATKFGIAPKAGLGNPTWAGDLNLILEHVADLNSAEAAEALLEVASIGIDQGKYTREMAPYEVRSAGEKWAARLTSAPAREALAKAARGELKTDKARAVAMQVAGVKCLGLLKDASQRATIEQQLGDGDELVRITAAEALADLDDDAAAPALIGALERDTADAVLVAVAQSLRRLYSKYLPKLASAAAKPADAAGEPGKEPAAAPAEQKPAAPSGPPESTRLAVRAAIKALGRASWRADMALVRLLDDYRSIEAVPALIAVLERFRDHPEEVQSGKLSGLLLHSAHELLVGMTGAVIPATQPDKWRELWERDKDKLEITKKHEPKGPPTTVASGFCGIPVQGTRVLFILDLSGSMDFPMTGDVGDGTKGKGTRLLFAQRQLHRAMDLIAPTALFNLITFNKNPKAKAWSKEMVVANEKNRERFRKYVDDLEADGGTNLWSGLEEGLKIKSLVYGDRYETNVDEVFILSDGAPSLGDVLDPIEILRLVRESNRFACMRINTIYISSPDPAERQPMPWMTITPEELMKRMAEQNGGKFINL